jgi:hypothetical protein
MRGWLIDNWLSSCKASRRRNNCNNQEAANMNINIKNNLKIKINEYLFRKMAASIERIFWCWEEMKRIIYF